MKKYRIVATALSLLCAQLVACSEATERHQIVEVESEGTLAPSWEAYRDAARAASGEYFVVEGDLTFSNEASLREHYDQTVEATSEKLAVAQRISTGEDQVFEGSAALDIVYCVNNNFENTQPNGLRNPPLPSLGDQKDEAIADIAAAARAWEAVINVRFRYDPTQDEACTDDNDNVDFAFQNIANDYYAPNGCAMNKMMDWAATDYGCIGNEGEGSVPLVSGVLVADYNEFPWPEYPTATRVGLLTHELGHILGFRHEFAFYDEGTPCEEAEVEGWDLSARQLTPYDEQSVMNYFVGSCPTVDEWVISDLDGVGARSVYGMPVSWYVAGSVI